MKSETKFITKASVTAAIYVILTLLSYVFGLSGNMIQLRISECLTILPAFGEAFVPGLTVGCLIANILTGASLPDIIIGTLATFIGAYFTGKLKDKSIFLKLLPPIISNTVLVPLILYFFYGLKVNYLLITLWVFIGEFISAGVFGFILYEIIIKNKKLRELL